MDEDRFNIDIRKFLKEVGVTSQREIERVVREGQVKGGILKLLNDPHGREHGSPARHRAHNQRRGQSLSGPMLGIALAKTVSGLGTARALIEPSV
jgi:16S rRNA U516 pseudouridylate synthase RsuA-like enzyme